jgi:hypothetical protein
MNFLRFIRFFFRFVLFEYSPAHESIGLRIRGGFFVFGLHEIGGERGNLVVTQIGIAANRCGFSLGRSLRRFGCLTGRCGRRLGFSAGIGQEPAGQSPREPARDAAAARSRGRGGQITGRARYIFFNGGLLLACFVLNAGNRWGRNRRLAAVFCQRFTRENDLVFGDACNGRRRAARSFRTAIVVSARLCAAIIVSAGLATLW